MGREREKGQAHTASFSCKGKDGVWANAEVLRCKGTRFGDTEDEGQAEKSRAGREARSSSEHGVASTPFEPFPAAYSLWP